MDKIKSFLPDALAVVLFIAIGFLYFFQPVTEGLSLTGHDHSGGIGAGVEMQEYYQRTGERTRWTNVLFSGMPTYQMAPSYDSTDTLVGLQKVYQLGLTGVVMYVFVMLLGFYILLRAFDFKVWMSALGAILWAFSSYFFIIIAAGHIWKLMALAYIPPTIAGLVLCYRGKYIWGGLVTAFFLALQILSNHLQMTYYFLPVMGMMALAYLIQAVREKKLADWCKATGVLVLAGVLGVAVNASNLYHTYQYSKESMRSKSELTYKNTARPENQTKSGLERDYITQWSYGIGETWTLLVPDVKGGASVPLTASETAMEKLQRAFEGVNQFMQPILSIGDSFATIMQNMADAAEDKLSKIQEKWDEYFDELDEKQGRQADSLNAMLASGYISYEDYIDSMNALDDARAEAEKGNRPVYDVGGVLCGQTDAGGKLPVRLKAGVYIVDGHKIVKAE